jgi:hypothetical protein
MTGDIMREWKTRDIEKRIREKMPAANRSLVRGRRGKVVRRRPRDKEEQDILDLLCKRKWEDDLARGKVKIINKREWYCEFD